MPLSNASIDAVVSANRKNSHKLSSNRLLIACMTCTTRIPTHIGVREFVRDQIRPGGEAASTQVACVGSFSGVGAFVGDTAAFGVEALVAELALERSLPCVGEYVPLEEGGAVKLLSTKLATVDLTCSSIASRIIRRPRLCLRRVCFGRRRVCFGRRCCCHVIVY